MLAHAAQYRADPVDYHTNVGSGEERKRLVRAREVALFRERLPERDDKPELHIDTQPAV